MKLPKIVKDMIPYFIIIIAVLLVKQFIVTPIIVNGTSMEPTLKNGDLMILTKFSYWFSKPDRFDVVVIDDSLIDEEIIKRVIGLPGDNVKFVDNKLYINGEELEESFRKRYDDGTREAFNHVYTDNFDFGDFPYSVKEKLLLMFGNDFSENVDELTIPDNFYFVCGDNRSFSYDSRKFGFVNKNQIEGKALFTFWPVSRFKFS